jgi:hypothetical protein
MSLINDALKKAARQRAEDQGDVMAPMPGGRGRDRGRGAPMRSQTMVLIGAAALVLIVVSAVITGLLVTGKSQPKVIFVAAAVPAPEVAAPVVVQMPAISLAPLPKPTPTVAAVSAPVISAPPAQVAVAAAVPPSPSPTVSVPEPSHADRVEAFLDKLHVSGVRSAGSDSKALVDGHVYRVNDVLDRPLGLRLVKIEEGQLTFVDSRGSTFIKNF